MILVLLAGCELNEEVVRRENYTAKIKIREASLDELLGERKFMAAYNKVYTTKEKSRTMMEAQYGFTIVPHGAKVIEADNRTSYTFKITREHNSPAYFENLVINVDSLEQTSAYIVKYTKSTPLSLSNVHGSFYFKGDIHISPIKYNIEPAERTLHCVTATIMMCKEHSSGNAIGPVHVAGPNCNNNEYLYGVTTTTCDMTAGGGSFGGGAGGYSGGDGMGGSGGGGDGEVPTDGDILTPPNNCPRCPDFTTAPVEDMVSEETQSQIPCKKLKSLLKQKYVKGSVNHLKNKLNENLETVYSLEYNQQDKSVSLRPGSSGTRRGVIRVFPTTFGAAHNHPVNQDDDNSCYPMFSADDLFTPYLIAINNSNNIGTIEDYPITNIMVAPNNTYALIPNDMQTLANLSVKFSSDNTILEFNDELRKIYEGHGKPWNVDQSKLAKEFLNFVNGKYNLNISIYQISNDDLYSANPIWSEVIIDPNNPSSTIKKPCNQ